LAISHRGVYAETSGSEGAGTGAGDGGSVMFFLGWGGVYREVHRVAYSVSVYIL